MRDSALISAHSTFPDDFTTQRHTHFVWRLFRCAQDCDPGGYRIGLVGSERVEERGLAGIWILCLYVLPSVNTQSTYRDDLVGVEMFVCRIRCVISLCRF